MNWESPYSDSMIPLGILLETGELVDIADVLRGRSCGCVCPSCEGSLVAKQGDSKQWHFAHDSRPSNPPHRICESAVWGPFKTYAINYYAGSGITTVTLPGHPGVGSEDRQHYNITITRSDKSDLAIVFPTGHKVLIEFEYPGADFPLGARENPADGVIAINLDSILIYYDDLNRPKKWIEGALDRLWNNLSDSRHTEWYYHPKQPKGYSVGINFQHGSSRNIRTLRRPPTFDLADALLHVERDFGVLVALEYRLGASEVTLYKLSKDPASETAILSFEGGKLFENCGFGDDACENTDQLPADLRFFRPPGDDIYELEVQYTLYKIISGLKLGVIDDPCCISGNSYSMQRIFELQAVALLKDAQLISY